FHPTQKPPQLYRWILQNYAKPGDKIIDTHGGSMSSAIACDIEGFDLDICEIDHDYFIAGKQRFEYHKRQLKLF
ncbi:MAG TPA: DNA methyltransferase, partial [Bacteroidales bacterium]|nr:DNA methyltransferase [Bacteroidales bacterium]